MFVLFFFVIDWHKDIYIINIEFQSANIVLFHNCSHFLKWNSIKSHNNTSRTNKTDFFFRNHGLREGKKAQLKNPSHRHDTIDTTGVLKRCKSTEEAHWFSCGAVVPARKLEGGPYFYRRVCTVHVDIVNIYIYTCIINIDLFSFFLGAWGATRINLFFFFYLIWVSSTCSVPKPHTNG